MADIIKMNPSHTTGNEILSAARTIRDGLGKFRELDGLRANAVGKSQDEARMVLGAATNTDAQMLSDRMGALVYHIFNPASEYYATFAFLRDMIDAISQDSA